jgi:hypothetical protein
MYLFCTRVASYEPASVPTGLLKIQTDR